MFNRKKGHFGNILCVFFFLVFNQFFETHGRSFVATSSEDRVELVKIKSDLFTKLNISSDLLSDDLFSDE